MLGPSADTSAQVNQVIARDGIGMSRILFLLRIETASYAQPSCRKAFADSITLEQAAADAGLDSSEIPSARMTEDQRQVFLHSFTELNRLRAAAGLTFQ